MGELKLPPGIVRTIWSQYQNPRRVKSVNNPLVRCNTGYHSFMRALIPVVGVAQREKATVNISATPEIVENATTNTL